MLNPCDVLQMTLKLRCSYFHVEDLTKISVLTMKYVSQPFGSSRWSVQAQLLKFIHVRGIYREYTWKHSASLKMYQHGLNFLFTEDYSISNGCKSYRDSFVHVPFNSRFIKSGNAFFKEDISSSMDKLSCAHPATQLIQEFDSTSPQNAPSVGSSSFCTQHVPLLEKSSDLTQMDVSERFYFLSKKLQDLCHRNGNQGDCSVSSVPCIFETECRVPHSLCDFTIPDYGIDNNFAELCDVGLNTSKFLDTSLLLKNTSSCGDINNQQPAQQREVSQNQFPLTYPSTVQSSFQTKEFTQNPTRPDNFELEAQHACTSLKTSYPDGLSVHRNQSLRAAAAFSDCPTTLGSDHFRTNPIEVQANYDVETSINPPILDNDIVRPNSCFSSLDIPKAADGNFELNVTLEHIDKTSVFKLSDEPNVKTSVASLIVPDLTKSSINHTHHHHHITPCVLPKRYHSDTSPKASPSSCLTSLQLPKTSCHPDISYTPSLRSTPSDLTRTTHKTNIDSCRTPTTKRIHSSSLLSSVTSSGRVKRTRQHVPHAMRTPAAVDKRNKRERRRIGGVNHAFEILRQHTPTLSHLERASKISILRQAQAYIRELRNVLAGRNCCL